MKHIITIILAGIVAQGVYTYNEQKPRTQDQLIEQYYASEVATLVSPHSIRKRMVEGKEDFILVDVRSEEEYLLEHAVGAVNIPAYVDKENSEKTDRERIISDFSTLIEENPGKEIIIYCYSSSCMTGRKIGNTLAAEDIFVHEMTVGWNEWRHFWQQWNYPHEWENINPLDYVTSGSEPGEFQGDTQIVPCDIDNEFGC